MRAKLEILAMVLGFLGLFGTIAATAMPMWRVSAFIGANIIVMEDLWEGLWMNCFKQIDKMQCKMYDSLLILPPELQAARGLMCVSIVLVVISLCVTGCGFKKTNCCNDDMKSKNITLAIGAALYLLSFLTTIIPVSWVTHTVVNNFYNPVIIDSRKHELGAAIYVTWATSAILLITGIILLWCFCTRSSKERVHYPDIYVPAAKDEPKANSVYGSAPRSSLHRHHEYV